MMYTKKSLTASTIMDPAMYPGEILLIWRGMDHDMISCPCNLNRQNPPYEFYFMNTKYESDMYSLTTIEHNIEISVDYLSFVLIVGLHLPDL